MTEQIERERGKSTRKEVERLDGKEKEKEKEEKEKAAINEFLDEEVEATCGLGCHDKVQTDANPAA